MESTSVAPCNLTHEMKKHIVLMERAAHINDLDKSLSSLNCPDELYKRPQTLCGTYADTHSNVHTVWEVLHVCEYLMLRLSPEYESVYWFIAVSRSEEQTVGW